jgi:hypothetical protein
MFTKRNLLSVFAALAFTGSSISVASACSSGFIAGTLCQNGVINDQASENADGAHALLGNPGDRIANKIIGKTPPKRTPTMKNPDSFFDDDD